MLFVPRANYPPQPPARIWILEFGRNPSTDYYIVPRCTTRDAVPHTLIDMTRIDPETLDVPPATFVIIVRYITGDWLRFLLAQRQRQRLSGVAYFMDDDLPSALGNRTLPLRYRYKILRHFFVHSDGLARLCSEAWVSTRHLAEKYGIDRRCVLEPLPLAAECDRESPVTFFYEGTASHLPEFRWLHEVVSLVQARSAHLTFITVGGREVRRMFAGMPRTLCLHPADWETYRQSFPALRHDIGLAPLVDDSRFNRGRSYTKFFDFTRFGAVGIYSNAPPYSDFVRSGIDGLLLPNDPSEWCSAITELGRSQRARANLLANAEARVADVEREPRTLPIGRT